MNKTLQTTNKASLIFNWRYMLYVHQQFLNLLVFCFVMGMHSAVINNIVLLSHLTVLNRYTICVLLY